MAHRSEVRSPDPVPSAGFPKPANVADAAPPRIQTGESKFFSAGKRHEDSWKRTPNITGTGAIHMKSFHCKLNEESMALMDAQVNEWLDSHPQYEVKFVTTAVGTWLSKTSEPHLILNVWL